jgi:hypothetical protein
LVNRNLFTLNSDIHGFSTRYANDFHLPSAKLKLFQKGVFYSGIKTHNRIPKTIKELSHDVKQFRLALKRFIILKSFYSLEEYFDINWKWVMFCYTGYTAHCKMACWCQIWNCFYILICIKFHYCVLLTPTDTNFTCIYCMLLFFLVLL